MQGTSIFPSAYWHKSNRDTYVGLGLDGNLVMKQHERQVGIFDANIHTLVSGIAKVYSLSSKHTLRALELNDTRPEKDRARTRGQVSKGCF